MNGNDDAVQALRDRGIDNGDELLEYGTPDEILAACRRWDTRAGVGPGLLASWIRNGDFAPPDLEKPTVADRLKAQFLEHQARLPVGTPAYRCTDPECIGIVRVEESNYPILILQCSVCRVIDGWPIRELHRLKPLTGDDAEEVAF